MQSIKNFLEKSIPLKPVKTDIRPRLKPRPNWYKSVIFDIYGTLLVSASGDIDKTSLSSVNMVTALNFCGIKTTADEEKLSLAIPEYRWAIKEQQEAIKNPDRNFPEIDIRKVWENLLKKFYSLGITIDNGTEPDITRIAFIFELLSNRVYPMPGMVDILYSLHDMDIKLGIVSNAQFYTPIIMNYFMSGNIIESERIDYFQEELSLYSYKEMNSKPELKLFEKIRSILEDEFHIAPHETLYVGNDMYKDIYPASKAGLKTALFAGDKRSLRLMEDKKEVKGIEPDYIITELSQLRDIV